MIEAGSGIVHNANNGSIVSILALVGRSLSTYMVLKGVERKSRTEQVLCGMSLAAFITAYLMSVGIL
jgi:hypothetical protein